MAKRLCIILISALLYDCTPRKEVPEIVPTAFEPPKVGEFGMTVQQSAEHSTVQFERIKRNTLNHKIPDVPVLAIDNSEKILSQLIDKPTFILTADTHCGIGLMYVREFFPEIWNRPSVDRSQFEVICLVKTYGDQTIDSPGVLEFRDELATIYHNTFIISEENSLKMNGTAGVLTHFVDEKGTVKYYGPGSSMNLERDEKRFDHILSLQGI